MSLIIISFNRTPTPPLLKILTLCLISFPRPDSLCWLHLYALWPEGSLWHRLSPRRIRNRCHSFCHSVVLVFGSFLALVQCSNIRTEPHLWMKPRCFLDTFLFCFKQYTPKKFQFCLHLWSMEFWFYQSLRDWLCWIVMQPLLGNVIHLNIYSESSTTLLLSQKRVRVDVCSKKFECSKVDCRSLLTMSAPQSMLNAPFHGNVIGR